MGGKNPIHATMITEKKIKLYIEHTIDNIISLQKLIRAEFSIFNSHYVVCVYANYDKMLT